jgi:AGCS family alanine or glycine:cation symporter
MTANAFDSALGASGRYMLTLAVILFSITTMISYSYYGLKCAKYLFGARIGQWYLAPYLISMPVAAWWSQDTVINIIDTCFAFMAIPTLISTLLLNGKVRQALREYFLRMGI